MESVCERPSYQMLLVKQKDPEVVHLGIRAMWDIPSYWLQKKVTNTLESFYDGQFQLQPKIPGDYCDGSV